MHCGAQRTWFGIFAQLLAITAQFRWPTLTYASMLALVIFGCENYPTYNTDVPRYLPGYFGTVFYIPEIPTLVPRGTYSLPVLQLYQF